MNSIMFEFQKLPNKNYDLDSCGVECAHCRTYWCATIGSPLFTCDGLDLCRKCFVSFQDSTDYPVFIGSGA